MARETIVIVISILLASAGCKPRQEALFEKELALTAATGIPVELLPEIKHAGKNLRRLQGVDPNGDPLWGAGVTIDVKGTRAPRTVQRLQEKAGAGNFAFISTGREPFPSCHRIPC
jgi:hypothetical protein